MAMAPKIANERDIAAGSTGVEQQRAHEHGAKCSIRDQCQACNQSRVYDNQWRQTYCTERATSHYFVISHADRSHLSPCVANRYISATDSPVRDRMQVLVNRYEKQISEHHSETGVGKRH
jgi:hypothetical protein